MGTELQSDVPLLVLDGQVGHEPVSLHGLQILLAPYSDQLILVWWLIFAAVSFLVLHRLYVAYVQRSVAQNTEAFEESGSWYYRYFSIDEIARSTTLIWVFGSLIVSYLVTFFSWFNSSVLTATSYQAGSHTCPPHFQSCGEWYFLERFPEGYSQPLLYALFFALLLLAVQMLWQRRFVLAHAAMLPLVVFHAAVILFFSETLALNFQYYLLIFSIIFFFLPHKEFFLKLYLVLAYFLSTSVKIHESWVLGTYFSTLVQGLPPFPKWSIPIWTNLVILMEMVSAWWLMGKPDWKQRSVFWFFVAFHVYSVVFVGFRYPLIVLPVLYILFGMFYRQQTIPFDRKALVGWALVIAVCGMQAISHVIPGDEKLTLEGNKYGQYMFEANHQCVSDMTLYYQSGVTEELRVENARAVSRCNPYNTWFRLNQFCRVDPSIERIAWTHDHSINGGPFYRIVAVDDACALSYLPFTHNDWIKTENDNPEIVGLPVENTY